MRNYKNNQIMAYEEEDDDFASYPSNRYSKIYNELLKHRTLILSGDIEREAASDIIAMLLFLEGKSPGENIKLYINSPGGNLVDGLFCIYDAIQMISSPVQTICIGEACSSAAVLLSAGTKGLRAATINSRIMIHQVRAEGSGGRGTDIEIDAKETKAIKRQMTEMLAKHTGQPYRKVYRDCENDKWFSAEDAKKYGIIDLIIQPGKPVPELKTRKRSKKKPQ